MSRSSSRPGPDHALQDLGREERVTAHAIQHAAQARRRRAVQPVLGQGRDVGRAEGTELDDVGPGSGEARPLEVLSQAFPGLRLANSHMIADPARRDGRARRTKRLTGSVHCVSSIPIRSGLCCDRSSSRPVTSSSSSSGSAIRRPVRRVPPRSGPAVGRSAARAAVARRGDIRPIWSALPTPHANCIAAACSVIAANTADLPIPGSPSSTSTRRARGPDPPHHAQRGGHRLRAPPQHGPGHRATLLRSSSPMVRPWHWPAAIASGPAHNTWSCDI